MAADHFIVALRDSQWKISFQGTDQGPYASKEAALEVAIGLARQAHAEGRAVEVLVQDIESNFHRAWSSDAETS